MRKIVAGVVTSSMFRGLDMTSNEETRYAYNMLTGKTLRKKTVLWATDLVIILKWTYLKFHEETRYAYNMLTGKTFRKKLFYGPQIL